MKRTTTLCILLGSALACLGQTNFGISIQPQSQIVPVGASATFSVTVTGAGPFTYQWQFNGTNLSAPGTITTVAGGGGSLGDSGPATNAA